MTAPVSQPLTKEERAAIREGLPHMACPKPGEVGACGCPDVYEVVESILHDRTAALLDRLKAAEGEYDAWRFDHSIVEHWQERAETAEADKARAVAEAKGEGYILALREVAAAYIEQAPNGAVKTTDLILWLQDQADAFEAREFGATP